MFCKICKQHPLAPLGGTAKLSPTNQSASFGLNVTSANADRLRMEMHECDAGCSEEGANMRCRQRCVRGSFHFETVKVSDKSGSNGSEEDRITEDHYKNAMYGHCWLIDAIGRDAGHGRLRLQEPVAGHHGQNKNGSMHPHGSSYFVLGMISKGRHSGSLCASKEETSTEHMGPEGMDQSKDDE